MQISKDGFDNQVNISRIPTDICVCCGAPVPEGRQICWACEHKFDQDEMELFRPAGMQGQRNLQGGNTSGKNGFGDSSKDGNSEEDGGINPETAGSDGKAGNQYARGNKQADAYKTKKAEGFKGFIRKIESLVEIFVLTLAYCYIWKFFYRGYAGFYYDNGKYLLAAVYAFLVLILFYLCDSFQYGHRKLTEVFISQWLAMLLINVVTYFQLCLIGYRMLNPLPMVLLFGIDMVVTVFLVAVYTMIYHQMYVPKNMVMIYGNEKAVDLKFKMDERPDKYHVTKVVSCENDRKTIIGEIEGHDAVIINDVPAQVRNDILKYCYAQGVRTYVVPKISDIIQRGGEEITLFDTPLYLIRGRGLTPAQKFAKRVLDLVLCVIALIPALPIMAVVAICIKAEDHGPVFYRQERVTEGGRVFEILKFRSMVVDAEKEGKSIPAVDHDPRITKVGRVIRAARLDELPQTFNILKGDMSWVGPRPERVEHMEKYSEDVPEFALRTKVKGGLTGYAQIYGKYNTSAYDKLRLDLMYIENYSLMLDIKLIFMTVQILVRKESTEGFDKAEEMERKREDMLLSEQKQIDKMHFHNRNIARETE
ncbi:MAG: sugar transferase [Clostridiales bacterium]|nr:sugar transferase [Clostridiales bacterium]